MVRSRPQSNGTVIFLANEVWTALRYCFVPYYELFARSKPRNEVEWRHEVEGGIASIGCFNGTPLSLRALLRTFLLVVSHETKWRI